TRGAGCGRHRRRSGRRSLRTDRGCTRHPRRERHGSRSSLRHFSRGRSCAIEARLVTAARVVIVGVSTRAAAESAAGAGFDVTAIDAFADVDQHPAVLARALPGPFTARAAAEAARSIECDAVAYLANFENHPVAVRALRANRALWGNPPEVLQRVRDPLAVAEALRERGC